MRLLTASRQVLLDGEPLPLTRLEFDLLLFLAERPRRVFTRAQLLAGVWGYEHTGERTVDVHVRRLRLKLGSGHPADHHGLRGRLPAGRRRPRGDLPHE